MDLFVFEKMYDKLRESGVGLDKLPNLYHQRISNKSNVVIDMQGRFQEIRFNRVDENKSYPT
jgi:hypothetical protein